VDSASFQFVLFGLAAAILSNFSRSRVWRSLVLFAASIVFRCLLPYDPSFLLLAVGRLLSTCARPIPVAFTLVAVRERSFI
jgi:hypothetical protein